MEMKKEVVILVLLFNFLFFYLPRGYAQTKEDLEKVAEVTNDYFILETDLMSKIDMSSLKDGTYKGEDKTPLGKVEVSVSLQNGKIKGIDIIKNTFSQCEGIKKAFNTVPKDIVSEQSLDVDAVTGATVSSNSIKYAVFDALKKAMGH